MSEYLMCSTRYGRESHAQIRIIAKILLFAKYYGILVVEFGGYFSKRLLGLFPASVIADT